MKIHTNTLTFQEILAAVPAGCYLAFFTTKDRPNEPRYCVQSGSRSHDRAYTVRLSGSLGSAMRNLPDKAATWDEWGDFIAALFASDPEAKIGYYESRDDFISKTTAEYNRCTLYRPQDGLKALWLSHN